MVVNRQLQSNLKERAVLLPMAIIVAVGLLIAAPSGAGVHDPMRPQSEFVAADSVTPERIEFHLEATMVSAQRRVAIIDGSTISIGDLYQGYRVASIDEGSVVLARRGGKTSLILQPTIKTRTDEANGTLHHISGVD